MSLNFADDADDAALSRNEFMLRELFRDHFALADIFTDGTREMKQVALMMKGSESQQGLFDLMQLAASELAQHAGSVNTIGRTMTEAENTIVRTMAGVESTLKLMPRRVLELSSDRDVIIAMSRVIQEASRETLPNLIDMQKNLMDSVLLNSFGDAVKLKADTDQALQDVKERDEIIRVLRGMLSAGDGAAQTLRNLFFDETEGLAAIYTERGDALAENFANKTTAAVNKIKAQNSGLIFKYAFCAALAFVSGFAMHDSIYLQITKFMQ